LSSQCSFPRSTSQRNYLHLRCPSCLVSFRLQVKSECAAYIHLILQLRLSLRVPAIRFLCWSLAVVFILQLSDISNRKSTRSSSSFAQSNVGFSSSIRSYWYWCYIYSDYARDCSSSNRSLQPSASLREFRSSTSGATARSMVFFPT